MKRKGGQPAVTESNESTPYQVDPALVDKLMADLEASHAKAGTVPFWERQSLYLKFPTREEQRAFIERSLAPIEVRKCIEDNLPLIQNYPTYRFESRDGRQFGIFLDGDRILKLIDLEGGHVNKRDVAGVQRIKNLAGFIVEFESCDPTILFDDRTDIANAWEKLHVFLRVPITEEEDEYLNVILHAQPRFEIDSPMGADDGENAAEDSEEK